MNKLEPFADAIITAYVDGGLGLKAIAHTYKCSVGTVRALLINRGVSRRPPGIRTAKGVITQALSPMEI